MPELPEVETIRRDLISKILRKRIFKVGVRDKKIKSLSSLRGKKFVGIERRGKLLAFLLSDGKYLLAHLKMTGQLIYEGRGTRDGGRKVTAGGHKISKSDLEVPNKHTRVIFTFADKSQLFFNDLRRFGYLKIVSAEEKEKIWQNDFGLEPLTKNFKLADFKKLFSGRKTNVKALLMNQKLIAGIGNIYADEICFCARVLPWRAVSKLSSKEVGALHSCALRVLRYAIRNRGTTFKSFVDATGQKGGHYDFLKVYERDGEKCKRCGGVIKKTRHAGRGTHYCHNCQK